MDKTRTIARMCFCALFFAASALANDAKDVLGWNPVHAAAALDSRTGEWDTWEKSQRSLQTTCISCHTGGPYLLARSALQAAVPGIEDAATQQNLLSDVTLRTEKWSQIEPWYTFSDDKKSQSLGSEAVWNALLLADRDAQKKATGLSPETERAFGNLWSIQEADGAWAWLDFRLEPWESLDARANGAALAAIATGIAPGAYASRPGIAQHLSALQNYLKAEASRAGQSLHTRVFILWASNVLEQTLDPATQESIIDSLLALQQDDGGWYMSDLGEWRMEANPSSDAYATGLIVHVLKQSKQGDRSVAIERGIAWLKGNQDAETGGWISRSVNKERDPDSFRGQFMNDAATAYAVLALTSSTR